LAALALPALLVLGSCGGGGGGGGGEVPPEPPPGPPPETVGVFTGFNDTGNLNWESTGGGDGGVGDGGADGDGGVGAGGDFGQFRGAQVCVFLDNGTQLGCALTDNLKGMVTIKPGRAYRGGLRIELAGTPTASYYEEGRDVYVPFPADRKIRAWVPFINRNIGITPFTEAAYRLLTEGSAPESVGNATPTKAQIRAANERVRLALNEHFPTALHVDDIARLPFIKSQSLPAGSMRTDPRGRYGLVNGAFSKQASFHNGQTTTPTLDAVRQLANDLLDGRIDGRNGDQPAVPANARTYDPHTLTGELSSALAEQAQRFGAQEALDVLPKVVNYGNVRYEGYLFDGSINKAGAAQSTVAGWVAANTRNLTPGQQFTRLPGRALVLYANNGHGGGFYKADANTPGHKVFAIGDNVNGELGLGTRTATNTSALEITLPGAPSHIVGGFAHTLARMADGTVWAWGDNSFGQLGQNDASLAASLSPRQVTLPVAAVAVAATSGTSYALGSNGKVYAWGANGGFGLLGNGSADGVAQAPIEVAGLADIVQISARDNDVVVVRRDNTVWHWGSHPADESAFVAGDPGAPYLGGSRSPVQVSGLPAGVPVRKVLTEQGLFAALLANGHVYTWGVHFDITAGQVLRNASTLNATRMLGLPPLRDLMPGGFQGYGARAFDRLTGMGVDYDGGMWKVRGRVGEVYEPDTETSRGAQRRPQGQGPRPDCETCHTFLDEPLSAIKAASRQPTSGPECTTPTSVHGPLTASLIHAETDCALCHNPGRLNYPVTTPSGSMPFANNSGWPDCAKPASLLNRSSVPPPILNNSCQVPPNHVFTPPGTVCASCHNSVVARPLRDLATACAQPRSDELPTLPTRAAITGAVDGGGTAIAAGAVTPAARHELRGTLSAPLAAGQSLAVQRNGVAVGNAAANGTAWSLAVAAAPEGANAYRAQVVAGAAFGAFSNVFPFSLDATPPVALAAISGFTDDGLGAIAAGGFASDSTPAVNGTLSAAPGSGEVVQVLRDGVVVGNATVAALSWTFTEPAALGAGAYAYRARVADAAGNTSAPSAAAGLSIVAALPTLEIIGAVNNASAPIPNGSTTSDATPAFSGTLSAALPGGHAVRVYRDGTALAGNAAVSGLTWSYTDPGAADGLRSYTARVEAGGVQGAFSPAYAITIDTVAPTQVASVTQIADDANGNLAPPVTTADSTPIINGTLSTALGGGEVVQVLRSGTVVGTAAVTGQSWSYTEQPPGVPVPPGSTSVAVTYSARVVDAAGLIGPLTGGTIAVTVSPGSFPLLNAMATITTISSRPLANPAEVSYVTAPVVAGTLQRALLAGEVLNVYRNTGTPVVSPPPCGIGSAALAGSRTQAQLAGATSFSIATSAIAANGLPTYYVARIEQAAVSTNCGASANTATTIVTTPLAANATAAVDINNVSIAGGNTQLAPRISGMLSAALRTGEALQIRRTLGGVTTTFTPTTVTAGGWTFNESAAPAAGSYSYAARTVDSAGNAGATGAAISVNVLAPMPTTSIRVEYSAGLAAPRANGTVVPSGDPIADTTPTVAGTASAALPAGASVRVYRALGPSTCTSTTLGSGACTFMGTATFSTATAWSINDTDATAGQGTRRYMARVENGSAYSAATSLYSVVVDTVAPAVTPMSIARARSSVMPGIATRASGDQFPLNDIVPNGQRTNDATPNLEVQLAAALGSNEIVILRDGVEVYRGAGTSSCGTNCYRMTVSSGLSIPAPATLPNTTANPIDTRTFVARVEDAAGNFVASANFSIAFGYHNCDFQRADATHKAIVGPATSHGTWTSTLACNDCHVGVRTSTGAAQTGATSVGSLVPVPSTTPTYWCRRP
jgi:hypothetical protein